MPSLNLCQFIGHCGADPEVRYFENGNKIATTRIAVSEKFTDRNNQTQERTEWISLVFNGKLADLAEKYVRKGSTIYVSGKWHAREWQDQGGNKRQSTELTALALQLLDKRDAQPQPQALPEPQSPAQPAYPQAPAPAQPYNQPAPPPQYQQPAPQQYAPPAQPQQYGPQPGYPPQYGGQAESPDLPF